MKRNIYIIIIILLLTSCGGSKKVTESASPYQRKPIVEVSEAELKVDAAQIDATTQMMIGHLTEAVDQYRKILKDNPDYASAHFEIGRIFLGSGWLDSALFHLREAVRLDNRNVWYQQQLAKVYERRHDMKNFTATHEEIVKQHPDVVDYYYDLSNAYLEAENVPASIEVLNRLEKRYGVTETVSLQKQRLWQLIDKPDKARAELERLAEAIPGGERYNAILAESYMAEKNYAKALQYYERILSTTPNDENIHISIASCYLAMKNYAKVYEHIRLGVSHPGVDCKDKLNYLTEFLRDKKFFTTYSRACFLLADTLAQQCSDSKELALVYGKMLAAQSRYGEAAKQFLSYLEADKNAYPVWESLLMCESATPESTELLLEHAKKASDLFPLQVYPYFILAKCHLDTGDCENARHYIERCIMLAPNDSEVAKLNQTIKQQCP